MLTIDWATAFEVAAGVAVGTVPVAAAYLLNERGARAQLGREQEYSRRRECYEKVLFALDLQKDLTETYHAFLRFSNDHPLSSSESGPLKTEAQVAKPPDPFVVCVSKIFAILSEILTDSQVPSVTPADLVQSKPEDRKRMAGIVVDTSLRGLARAGLDVQSACRSLILADGSEDFLERAQSLYKKVAMVGEPPLAFLQSPLDWEKIQSEINDLSLIALQDLKSILGEDIEIELSRTTPLRGVHVTRKGKRPPRMVPPAVTDPPTA